ncbi:MAG: DUF1540 domain-containing protein [Candidatus Caccovivens sp.]
MKNTNIGVRCNVNECVYNENGCKCNKEVIDVSKGTNEPLQDGDQPHYCKSFANKNKV